MDKASVSARIEEICSVLRAATAHKEPCHLKVNGLDTIVSRAEFLKFHAEWVLEQLNDIQETLDDEIQITHLSGGGAVVTFEGEAVLYTADEVAEMEMEGAERYISTGGDGQVDEQKEAAREKATELEALRALAAPLVEWIREHHDPHTEVHISWDHVWVRHDLLSLPFPYSEE